MTDAASEELIPDHLAGLLDSHVGSICALIAAERPFGAAGVAPRDYALAAGALCSSLALCLAQRLDVLPAQAVLALAEAQAIVIATIAAQAPGWSAVRAAELAADYLDIAIASAARDDGPAPAAQPAAQTVRPS